MRSTAAARCAMLCASFMTAAGCAPAADATPPPAPDYARADAWAAWPGRASGADTVPPGLDVPTLPEAQKVDVFFIHPTTYLSNAAPNARYDEPGTTSERIDRGVLRFQASVFNACCRIYAPRYRQASIGAFLKQDAARATAAYELAYADVLHAFDYYLAHENHDRPFILASHSQGSLHAMRLLQERIAGRPLQQRLVAAYIVGYSLPLEMEKAGVPVCRSAAQTGCFVDWNTVKEGHADTAREDGRLVWLDGRYQPAAGRAMTCVNPLDWRLGGSGAAALNLGALAGARPGQELQAPVAHLTGARCDDGVLHIDIPLRERSGFADLLTLFGSYHIFDYNIFYVNIRTNALERINAWRAAARAADP